LTDKVSRRDFLGGCTVAAVRLSGLTAGGAILFSARPAHAVEPTTVIAVAQGAAALWRMSRGGGPGIGSLLRKQTEMLAGISEQLTVVDARLRQIHTSIENLRNIVERLPEENVRKFYVETLSGVFTRAAEVMRTVASQREKYGIDYALAKVAEREDRAVLTSIQTSRSVLMNDRSEVVLPIVCAAWHIEFQLLASAFPFDAESIRASAETYQKYLSDWASTLDAQLIKIEAESKAAARTSGNEPWRLDCYTDISDTSWTGNVSYTNNGRRYTEIQSRVWASVVEHGISSDWSPRSPDDARVSEAFRQLEEAGIVYPVEVRGYWARTWIHQSAQRNYGWHGPAVGGPPAEAVRQKDNFLADARSKSCSFPWKWDKPAEMVPKLNQLYVAAQLNEIKALAYYSMKLCCRDALASVTRVLESSRNP